MVTKTQSLKENNLIAGWILYAANFCLLLSFITYGSFNVIRYEDMVKVALVLSGFTSIAVMIRAKLVGIKVPLRPAHLLIIMLFITLLASGPFFLTILLVNRFFDRSVSDIYMTEIVREPPQLKPRRTATPQIRVILKSNSTQTAGVIYPVEVSYNFLWSVTADDKVIVAIRKGALGFPYIASIEKADR